MYAVIKGDIVSSRKLINQKVWLDPLKAYLNTLGSSPSKWEIIWGDFFQIELDDPKDALNVALKIKALIKGITPANSGQAKSPLDVRMAIGIGEKTYLGDAISENNGPAYIYAGEKFDRLKKEQITIGLKSNWGEFDQEMNLYLSLLEVIFERWSTFSAELFWEVLKNPAFTQSEIGERLGIKQSGVSGRWNRAHIDKLLAVERQFTEKINSLLS